VGTGHEVRADRIDVARDLLRAPEADANVRIRFVPLEVGGELRDAELGRGESDIERVPLRHQIALYAARRGVVVWHAVLLDNSRSWSSMASISSPAPGRSSSAIARSAPTRLFASLSRGPTATPCSAATWTAAALVRTASV